MDIPKTMKAAVLFDYGDLRVTEVPVPALIAGEALVRVNSVAICGSDPAIIAKGWKGYPKLGEFIPGHEFTGTVAYEIGHRHYGFSTNGGYADYAACHVNTLHKIPDSISFEEGTMLTGTGTVLYGYDRIGWIRPGETVVVTGPGAIGLMSAHLAKVLGAGRVILTGTREERLSVGRELGVDITLNVREINVVETIMELTNGIGADMVVECTGQPAPAAEALEMIRKNGRISFNGIYHDPVTLQLDKIVQWNLLITGPKAEGMLNLSRAIPLMADGRINLKPLITHTFPLDEINSAFDTFTGRVGGAIKVIVKP